MKDQPYTLYDAYLDLYRKKKGLGGLLKKVKKLAQNPIARAALGSMFPGAEVLLEKGMKTASRLKKKKRAILTEALGEEEVQITAVEDDIQGELDKRQFRANLPTKDLEEEINELKARKSKARVLREQLERVEEGEDEEVQEEEFAALGGEEGEQEYDYDLFRFPLDEETELR